MIKENKDFIIYTDEEGNDYWYGEKVECSDYKDELWTPNILMGFDHSSPFPILCFEDYYKYIRKINQLNLVPWTLETCPVPPFAVRRKDEDYIQTISCVSKSRVWLGLQHTSYTQLMEEYVLIDVDRNEHPCGVLRRGNT